MSGEPIVNWKGAAELAQENVTLRGQLRQATAEIERLSLRLRLSGMTLSERVDALQAETARHIAAMRGERKE
jgi:hypothetical protein